jgi:hypothetical protein
MIAADAGISIDSLLCARLGKRIAEEHYIGFEDAATPGASAPAKFAVLGHLLSQIMVTGQQQQVGTWCSSPSSGSEQPSCS